MGKSYSCLHCRSLLHPPKAIPDDFQYPFDQKQHEVSEDGWVLSPVDPSHLCSGHFLEWYPVLCVSKLIFEYILEKDLDKIVLKFQMTFPLFKKWPWIIKQRSTEEGRIERASLACHWESVYEYQQKGAKVWLFGGFWRVGRWWWSDRERSINNWGNWKMLILKEQR